MKSKHTFIICLALSAVSLLMLSCSPAPENKPQAPNILLIIADDLGYSDLGSYGGEIDTPNIDELAKNGLRFTNFNVNPMCEVTRASILTGHTPNQSVNFEHSIPIAQLMKQKGYRTFLSGKWHQPATPMDAGFEDFYGFLIGQIDSWTGIERGQAQIQSGYNAPLSVPDNWYATDAFTNYAIEAIDKAIDKQQPFFGFLSYNAPHSPLHAPKKNVQKYPQRYQAGWDKLRQARFDRMLGLGIIDSSYVLSEPGAEVRPWNEIDPQSQTIEANRMAAYAGMVDRLDENVGKVIAHLQKTQQLDNTLIVFISDNGADYSNGNIANYDKQIPWEKHTRPHASNGWAMLKSTPFRFYKHSTYKGGVASPMIVHWPKQLESRSGDILKTKLHVSDLYPTFLSIANIDYPIGVSTKPLKPLYGHSFAEVFAPTFEDNAQTQSAFRDEIFWSYRDISRGYEKDDWKISSIYDGPWTLFNTKDDPAEHTNLAAQFPEKVTQLNNLWFAFANAETDIPKEYKLPIHNSPIGWGYHRLKRVMPNLVSTYPLMSQTHVPINTSLQMTFSAPLDFSKSAGKTIALYEVSNIHTPIWKKTLTSQDEWQGQTHVEFSDIPLLRANTTYFVLADRGWATSGKSALGPINDGAYWWRFKTKR